MSLLLVSLTFFFLVALIPAALVRSRGARIAILVLVPIVGTVAAFITLVELWTHGYLGGT
jgi:hypothetical protein